MSKKKLVSLGLVLTMVASMFAGCGKEEEKNDAPAAVATAAPDEKVTGKVYYFNFKPEATAQFEKAAE